MNYLSHYVYFFSTFVCPTELIAFSERAPDFANIDCQVLGVSTDSEFSHLAWVNTPRKVRFVMTYFIFTYFHQRVKLDTLDFRSFL